MLWRIYYSDSTFDSTDGSPYDAPGRGVQCLLSYEDDVGVLFHRGTDFYWWDGQWFGGDIFGLYDYLAKPGPKTVKFGEIIDHKKYQAILKRALADPDLPQKSAWRPEERR